MIPILSKHDIKNGTRRLCKTPPRHLVLVIVIVTVLAKPWPVYGAALSSSTDDIKEDSIGQFSGVLLSLYQLETIRNSEMGTVDTSSKQELTCLEKGLQVDANRNVPLKIVASNESVVYDVLHQAEQVGFVKTGVSSPDLGQDSHSEPAKSHTGGQHCSYSAQLDGEHCRTVCW
jgi:hypothetical protein